MRRQPCLIGSLVRGVAVLLACGAWAGAQTTESRGLSFTYAGPAEFVYPYDGKQQSIRFNVTNTAATASAVYALRIAVNGSASEYPGYAHFPNGSNFSLAAGESSVVSCWAQGVYENLGPTAPPAVGETKEYLFEFVFTDASRPIASADTFAISQKVRFTNLGDTPALAGGLALRGTVRFNGASTPPAGAVVEVATPYSPRWFTAATTVATGGGLAVAQALPVRNDWLARVSAPGYTSRLVALADLTIGTTATLDLALEKRSAPTPVYRLAKQVATPTGFWRGAVSESEGTFVAIPGQENWKTGATDAETRSYREASRLYKYRFDGTKLWEHAAGWEIWGGDMTPDGKFVAYALNPTQTNFYRPTEFKLVLLDGATGTPLWTRTGSASDNSPGSEAKKLESLEVALSPDGKYVAVGSTGSGQVSVFDRATGSAVWATSGALAANFGQVRNLKYSGDSQFLYVGSGDNFLRKLRASDGAAVWKAMVGGWPFVNGLNFSPDGAIITTGTKSFNTAGVRASDGTVLWFRNTQFFDSVPSPDGAVTTSFNGVIYRLADGAIAGMTKTHALSAYTPDGAYLLRMSSDLSLYDLAGVKLAAFERSGLDANPGEQPQWCHATRDGRYVIGLGRDMAAPGSTGIAIWELTSAAATAPAPTVSVQPASQAVAVGDRVTLSFSVGGTGPFTYQWIKDGSVLAGQTAAALVLPSAAESDAGAYVCVVTNAAGTVTTAAAVLSVAAYDPPRLSNLAVRTMAGPGAATLIVGFVTGGRATAGTKPLLLRGVGPSLGAFGVTGVLADPSVTLVAGGAGVGANDNWEGASALASLAAAVGAFPLASASSRDAALASSPAAGAYSLLITSADTMSGQVLAEIYDAATTFTATTPRLINLSTRTDLTAAGGPLLVGFTVAGKGGMTLLVRAVGPALAGFGVAGALADPQLVVFRGAASVATNDNWSTAANAALVAAAAEQVGAFALPGGSRDAALLVALAPGGYTAQVTGVAGATGNTLVEVYEVP